MIVALEELKTHLRIQHDEEDEYLESLLAQAQTAAEDYCRVKFDQVYKEPLNKWPCILLFSW